MTEIRHISQHPEKKTSTFKHFFYAYSGFSKFFFSGVAVFFVVLIFYYINLYISSQSISFPEPYLIAAADGKSYFRKNSEKRINPALVPLISKKLIAEARIRLQQNKPKEAELLFKMAQEAAPGQIKDSDFTAPANNKKYSTTLEVFFLKLAEGKPDAAWKVFDSLAQKDVEFFLYSAEFVAASLARFSQPASAVAVLRTRLALEPDNTSLPPLIDEYAKKLGRKKN